jgi:hypothetical protein
VARVDGTELHLSDVEAAQQNLPPQAQKLPLEQIFRCCSIGSSTAC